MDKDKETLTTWNNVASIYEEKFMDLDIYNETYDVICSLETKQNAKILEIGCGPGNITKYLLTKRPDFKILGIDFAPNMIEIARRNNPKAEFLEMDAREINQLNDKFDFIVSGFCLPYLSEKELIHFINQSKNLLVENGRIYLSFVDGESEKSEFKENSAGRVFFQYHKLDQVVKNLENFNDITITKVKYPKETEHEDHTIIIARKNAV